jgi:glycosyltransferase involved in cell wall biosynthesis
MPRQLANELGGFDTAYFMYGEDLDLCLRIQNAGFIVWWYPKQRVTHLKYSSGLGSNQKSIKLRIRWHFYDAMERFYRTHYERYYGFFISTLVYLVLAIQKRRVNPQMKVVALDGRLLYQTGVGVYIRNILYHLTAFSSEDIAYRIYARSSDIPRMQKELISISSVRYSQYMFCVADEKWHGFAEQITFLAKLYSGCYHLVHFTYFSWPIGYFGRFVATVHDTTPLEYTSGRLSIRHPMIYKIKRWVLGHVFRLQLQRALMIVVPSEAVKRALRRYTRRTDICVLSEGISADLLGAVSEPVRDLCPGRYILRAGNCYPHKNVEGFLSACANEKLVLVGPNDEFTSMLKRKHPQVTWLHNISPGQLRWLYENALCSVMPSFTEGFGLPVLESLHFHCPVACSNIPVFREIAGEYGYYFDPHDRDSIRSAVQKAKRAPHIALDLSGFNFATMTSGLVQIYRSHL